MAPRRAYLSAPRYNPPQEAAEEKICSILESAGFEVFRAAIERRDLDPDLRRSELESADLAVFHFDSLLPPGVSLHLVGGVTNQIKLPLDPQMKQVVAAGYKALGIQGVMPAEMHKKSILLPGEAAQASGAPDSVDVGFPPGVMAAKFLTPPLNITDPNVLVEIGMAMAINIPILGVAVGDVQCGCHVNDENLLLAESLEELKDYSELLAGAESIHFLLNNLAYEKRGGKGSEGPERTNTTEGN